ncbi:hypothetical protein B9Z19DRAFT_1118233 [Tuber borchii]|uniref:Uncharacterized protein n=1 Tax=Tuber borchii TaxID=42251 RepID=A0A2T7A8U1_TUBBO|nr:hypothetical protein B9Z19DRAFT_1118233 [Tuber borchii]
MASTPSPLASPSSPADSAPQNPPDAGERTESAQETEQDKPHDRLLFDDEVKASIDAQEKMLLTMRKMCVLYYFMSESSSELSEAMIEYARVFEERARDDLTSSANQSEDNARFRCYSHASKFWSEMSTMQMAVHETLLNDYQHLNRQGARFFGLHASHDADDRLIVEYDIMLNRIEKVAGFHLPADFKVVESKVSEDAHLNPGYRKHARSKSEYSSKPRHTHPPPRACPVSGFTHEQVPHLEKPARYFGHFRHRWGELDIKASQILREASSGDERFKALFEMRDKLKISFAEKHNDALRDLETDFLTRVAVGLTNTGFDRLKDAYRKADEWASVVGLRTYANQLNLSPAKVQAKLDEPLKQNPGRPVIGSEFMNDEFQPDYQWDFNIDGSTNTTTDEIGRALSPGPLPEDLIEERAEDEDDESESDDSTSTSDDSTSPEDSEPGPNAPGHNYPRPPGGNSGSNSAGGASAGGRSNNSARGSGGRPSSANDNSFYSGSGNSYEGNRRPFEGLQASLLEQMIYELSDNELPSINSNSPSGSNCDSVGSLSTTQTSIGSIGDLFKSPKGSPSDRYTLTTGMTQPVPEVATTSVSPDTGTVEVALGKKGEKEKLSGATFGIVEISMGSKIVHGLVPGVAQAQNPFVNPFEDAPEFALLEDPDEDSVDDYKVIRPRRKHRHLRRVPRFVTLQGGKLQVFGRHNSYTGTGLKTKFPARGQPLKGYQPLNSSSSLPILTACDAVAESADLLSDSGSSGSTAFEPGNDLFYKIASGQAAGIIPQ